MAEKERIFVGGLPSDVNQEEIARLFKNFGTVLEVVIARDKCTPCSKKKKAPCRGFAHVLLKVTKDKLASAISVYNSCKFRGGNVLRVAVANIHFKAKMALEKEEQAINCAAAEPVPEDPMSMPFVDLKQKLFIPGRDINKVVEISVCGGAKRHRHNFPEYDGVYKEEPPQVDGFARAVKAERSSQMKLFASLFGDEDAGATEPESKSQPPAQRPSSESLEHSDDEQFFDADDGELTAHTRLGFLLDTAFQGLLRTTGCGDDGVSEYKQEEMNDDEGEQQDHQQEEIEPRDEGIGGGAAEEGEPSSESETEEVGDEVMSMEEEEDIDHKETDTLRKDISTKRETAEVKNERLSADDLLRRMATKFLDEQEDEDEDEGAEEEQLGDFEEDCSEDDGKDDRELEGMDSEGDDTGEGDENEEEADGRKLRLREDHSDSDNEEDEDHDDDDDEHFGERDPSEQEEEQEEEEEEEEEEDVVDLVNGEEEVGELRRLSETEEEEEDVESESRSQHTEAQKQVCDQRDAGNEHDLVAQAGTGTQNAEAATQDPFFCSTSIFRQDEGTSFSLMSFINPVYDATPDTTPLGGLSAAGKSASHHDASGPLDTQPSTSPNDIDGLDAWLTPQPSLRPSSPGTSPFMQDE
eukprot:gene14323-16937_t